MRKYTVYTTPFQYDWFESDWSELRCFFMYFLQEKTLDKNPNSMCCWHYVWCFSTWCDLDE